MVGFADVARRSGCIRGIGRLFFRGRVGTECCFQLFFAGFVVGAFRGLTLADDVVQILLKIPFAGIAFRFVVIHGYEN